MAAVETCAADGRNVYRMERDAGGGGPQHIFKEWWRARGTQNPPETEEYIYIYICTLYIYICTVQGSGTLTHQEGE